MSKSYVVYGGFCFIKLIYTLSFFPTTECVHVERMSPYRRRSSHFERRGGGHAYEVAQVSRNG